MFRLIVACSGVLLLNSASLAAETVTVRSGNGAVGGTDRAVTFLLGPATGPFNHTFTSADFTSAQSGPAAFILSQTPYWISGLPSDPSAHWIGTNPGGVSEGNTALYAIPFQISSSFSSATMTVNYAVDDAVGDTVINNGPNTGVYLNGSAACGGSFAIGFSQQHSASCGDVSSLVHVGTNWLYIEDGNVEGAAGLVFSATITTTPSTTMPPPTDFTYVPIPGTNSIQTNLMNTFPTGTFIANNALATPFSISSALSNCGPSGAAPCNYYDGFGSSGSGLSITLNVSVASPTDVYTLMNAYSPAAGEQLAIITFLGTGGTRLTFALIGGKDIRDYYVDGFANTLNNGVSGVEAVNAFTCTVPSTCQVRSGAGDAGTYHIDEQHFSLGIAFAGQTLTQIVFTDTYNVSNPILLGVTVGAPSLTPAPQPSITNLSPPSAQAGSGPLPLTINGTGFIPVSSVTFNSASHAVTFVSGNQLAIVLSASDLAVPGAFAVSVTNPSPGGGNSNSINFTVSVAVPTITSVTNSATELTGSISPGEIVSIYGTDLGPANPLTLELDANGNAATSLGGVQVFFSGTAAPLAYVSSSQINAVVPYEIDGILNPTLYVSYADQTSNSITLTSAPSVPGLFTQNGSGSGPGAILNGDGTLNSTKNPAAIGSYIMLYLTGEGQTAPPGVTGKVTTVSPTPPLTPQPLLPVTVSIGGQTANVAFYGEAPGLVSGVLQINAQIPPNAASGNVQAQVVIGDATSNIVTVAVALPPNPSPSITGLSPSSAQAGSGPLTLTINGSGFIPASSVPFRGTLHSVSFVNGNQLAIALSVSDLATAGTFPVVVTNPQPGGGSSNTLSFAVTAAPNPQPSITGLSPSSAQAGSGPLTLTINGSGFFTASTVVFNSVSHASTFVNSSQLTITLSSADLASAGSFAVLVTNPPPGGGTSNPFSFTLTTPVQPGLTGAWQGSWSSSEYAVGGALAANLNQSGAILTGTITFFGSSCFSGGSLSGTVNGNTVSATIDVGGGQTISISAAANVAGTSVSGNYVLRGGSCALGGDSGVFSLTLGAPPQNALTGSWAGTWVSGEYLVLFGKLSANLSQSGSNITGTASFTGSACFSSGSIIGTITGNTLSGSIALGGSQTLSITAIVNAAATSINGNYTLRGGSCAPNGDAGIFLLTKSQ